MADAYAVKRRPIPATATVSNAHPAGPPRIRPSTAEPCHPIDGSKSPAMPVPILEFDDPDAGQPRQPVPLRYAYLVVHLSFHCFLGLLAERVFDHYELLTAYEFRAMAPPGKVRREFYEQLATNTPPNEAEAESVARLPSDQFVWSDELAAAFSDQIDLSIGREQANEEGMELEWHPAFHGLNDLLEECVDLSSLHPAHSAVTLTGRDLQKQETLARQECWALAYDELRAKNSTWSISAIAREIARMPIAKGRYAETIRKSINRYRRAKKSRPTG